MTRGTSPGTRDGGNQHAKGHSFKAPPRGVVLINRDRSIHAAQLVPCSDHDKEIGEYCTVDKDGHRRNCRHRRRMAIRFLNNQEEVKDL